MSQIGIIMNEKSEIASLTDGVKITLFDNSGTNQSWEKMREISFETTGFYPIHNLIQMREFLSVILKELGECKILIGTVITGVPYMILDQNGIMLCEAETWSADLLSAIEKDYIAKEKSVLETDRKKEKVEYPKAPYQTLECGIYELDLRKLQEAHPEISSKMALIPFLKTAKFEKLYIYCNHIMPWLDVETMKLNIHYHGEKWKEGYRIEIQPR